MEIVQRTSRRIFGRRNRRRAGSVIPSCWHVRTARSGCLDWGCDPSCKLPTVRVLVIVPTYNEIDNIARVIELAGRALPDAGILVVDDASPDGTADTVESLREGSANLHLLRREAKSGLGSAYRAGLRGGG